MKNIIKIIIGIVGVLVIAGTISIIKLRKEAKIPALFNSQEISGIAEAFTQTELEGIKNKIAAIQIAASNLNEIIAKVEQAILVDKDGNIKISLTIEQKQALKDEYLIRKQALIDAINSLL